MSPKLPEMQKTKLVIFWIMALWNYTEKTKRKESSRRMLNSILYVSVT